MGTRSADAFTIFQASNVVPDAFFVAKGWPAVFLRFQQEGFHGPYHRCLKEQSSCNAIIKLDRIVTFFPILLDPGQKIGCLPVTRVLCVMSVEVANAVRSIVVLSSIEKMADTAW